MIQLFLSLGLKLELCGIIKQNLTFHLVAMWIKPTSSAQIKKCLSLSRLARSIAIVRQWSTTQVLWAFKLALASRTHLSLPLWSCPQLRKCAQIYDLTRVNSPAKNLWNSDQPAFSVWCARLKKSGVCWSPDSLLTPWSASAKASHPTPSFTSVKADPFLKVLL